ncbi:YlzJ-like family protein [Paenibacillus sp. FJAT-26967]|uniref:YlzJ-like family protein n=1 Tax=Paenibacillus sp. FJAT-26967 TaxID=1729690 RepID=UPI000838EC9D|nr:YlzJ-like family protein [Paenibacillus sp. FJAT-26967]
MTHYSIVPEELVYEGWEDNKPAFRDIEVGGVLMQVEPVEEGRVRIIRLYSPDPSHYLNPGLAPGNVLESKPAFPFV